MAYVVLARKYRPRSFEQMVGQPHVVQALSNALERGRLHHAYLFTGTRGIGKTTISRILAKSLNCTGPDGQGGITARPCGVCGACTEIDGDRFIDYIELDAASNRGIDEVRDMIERAAYKPSVGRFKVFMIDEAHQLTKEAFNALLKTLEEPPDYLKFVLATTDPEKMLPTVLSRCLQFNLRPMSPDLVQQHLVQVLDAEAVPHESGALRLLARAARGSMRDALSLADQAIAYGGGRLGEAVVRTMLGAVDRGHAAGLVEALARRDAAALLAGIDALRVHGLSCAGTLEEMASIAQQMAVEQVLPGTLDADDAELEPPRRLAALLAPEETQLLYSIALHGRAELSLASDEYAALTMVLLRWLAFPASDAGRTAAAAPPARAQALRVAAPPAIALPVAMPAPLPVVLPVGLPVVPPVVPPVALPVALPAPLPVVLTITPTPVQADTGPAAAAPAATPAATPTDAALGDRWQALVRQLEAEVRIGGLLRELAVQAGLDAVDEQAAPPLWRLRVERESLRSDALRERLAGALALITGAALRLEVVPGVPTDSPALRDKAERERRQALAEATIREDPLVRELMGQYRTARIVPGSVRPPHVLGEEGSSR